MGYMLSGSLTLLGFNVLDFGCSSFLTEQVNKKNSYRLYKSAVCEWILETINNSLRPKKTEKSDQKNKERRHFMCKKPKCKLKET